MYKTNESYHPRFSVLTHYQRNKPIVYRLNMNLINSPVDLFALLPVYIHKI